MAIRQKVKNLLHGRKTRWRVFLFLGLGLTAVFLLAPLSSQAAWYDYLTPTGLASGFIGLVLKLILLVVNLLVRFANWFVSWTLGNPYNISYTRPGEQAPDNFIIEIGWTLLRDLVNMGFILGLAYIGLTTALDIGSKFKEQKTFFKLLLIALIVNFTPAICGAVVDVGNILGSFFIQGADFSTLSAIFDRQQSFLTRDWSNIITDGTLMFNTLMLIGFGVISTLVLCIYGILFLARGPIIWLLVILSPIAFFAFIFEKTKKQFDQWWELFLQWALILPVTLGFFLYLSMQVLVRTNEIMSVSGNDVSGFLNRLLPYAIPLGFLVAGLFLTTSKLMSGGAKGILNVAKGAGMGIAGAAGAGVALAGKKGLSGIRNSWQKRAGTALKPGEEGYEEWQQQHKARAKMNEIGRFAFGGATAADRAKWGTGGQVGREVLRAGLGAVTLGATYWANPARRRLSGKITSAIDEEQEQKFDKKVEEFKGKPTSVINEALENALPGIAGRQQRLAAAKAAIESGRKLSSFKALTPEMKKQIIKDAINIMPDEMNHFKAMDPIITAQLVNEMNLPKSRREQCGVDITEEERKRYGTYGIDPVAAKIIAEIKPNQMNSFTMDTIKIAASSGLINDFWSGPNMNKVGELSTLGSKAIAEIQKYMKEADYYKEIPEGSKTPRNMQLYKFINSSPGQALGLGFRDAEEKESAATTANLKQLETDLENKKIELDTAQRKFDVTKSAELQRAIADLQKQIDNLNAANAAKKQKT